MNLRSVVRSVVPRALAVGVLIGFAVILSGICIGPANAQTTTTFAQFKQQFPANKAFTYAAPSFHISSSPLAVFFNYGVSNQYDDVVNGSVFGGNINAFLTATATKSGSTTVQGTFLAQTLTAVTLAFALDPTSITAAQFAALGFKTNLLTVTGTALLSGPTGSQTPSLSADTLTGYSITYTSDFLTFPSSIVSMNYNLSFSGSTPPLGLNGSGELKNFVASGTGTFDYSTVPEGGSLLFLAFGLTPVVAAFVGCRRRKG